MFIRWQKRKRRDGVTRLNAVLCESRRVDGKPRQEHIAYLGAIDDIWLDQPLDDPGANLKRSEFWKKAEKRLAPLANLNSAMPAWETFLTEDEIWSVIIFLYEQTGYTPRTWEEEGEGEGEGQ